MALSEQGIIEIDLTTEFTGPSFKDHGPITYFIQNGKDSMRAQAESRATSDKALEIVDGNNLDHALSLWGAENSILHGAIAIKLLRSHLNF